jgi:chloramphenicol O-acetyltransferase type A
MTSYEAQSGDGFIDLDEWPRRHHFEFFREYESPFFNVTVQSDVTALVSFCKKTGHSYFLSSLYLATHAANSVEALRLRLRDGGVWHHQHINTGSTVLRDDETFAFGYFEFTEFYADFERDGRHTLQVLKESSGPLDDAPRDDVIYFSILPWIPFTSFQHAHRGVGDDSNPRIVFGKRHESGGRHIMPVSVEVHHALADGLHVGRFVEGLQERLDHPRDYLRG